MDSFGEEYGDKEIQSLIVVLRKQSPKAREKSIEITLLVLQMQQIGDVLKSNPDREPTFEELKEFFRAFLDYSIG